MKELKEELKYGKKGITLISLVVTIIVLLILAGVSIATLTGENGITIRANESKKKTEETQEKEGLELAVISSQMEDINTLEITEEKLRDAIKLQFGNNKDFSVTDNKDGSFLVNMNDTQRMYYIDETGEIIEQNKILKISTAEELKAFRDDVNSGNSYEGKYVYLTNNITLDSSEKWQPIGLYPMESTGPTDDENNKPFKGIFDGNKYEINGINIDTTNKGQGLFGIVNDGTIKNVTIGSENNINVGNISAGLVGYLYNGDIYNCVNESDINSTGSYVGGIAGFVDVNSTVEQCSNNGNITFLESGTKGEAIGGIVGQFMRSNILKCINTGIIKAEKNVGGICGYSSSAEINECINIGTINSSSVFSGGISGGIKNTIIISCYNTGNITANSWWSGGISSVAYESNKIENCYSIGNITGSQMVSSICKAATEGVLQTKNCYYLENTVNGSNETDKIEGVTSKNSEELKNLSETLGSSFTEDTSNINNGYPILVWEYIE